jgi:hypothetical protein
MKIDVKRVSTVATGDYYQALFESNDQDDEQADPFDPPAPYVLVQRQFESFDGGKCYIESHDEEYIGHFKLQLVEFSPTRLACVIARCDHKSVEVSFALTAADFEDARPIVEVIFGVREPDDDGL